MHEYKAKNPSLNLDIGKIGTKTRIVIRIRYFLVVKQI